MEINFNNVTIRESSIDDVQSIVNAFSDYLEEIKDIPEQELTFSNYNVRLFRLMLIESIQSFGICPAIAEYQNKKVGFNFWLQLSGFETKKTQAHALGTFIRPEFRKLGLATKLSQFSFAYLKEKGIEGVYGKVFKDRESSNKYTKDLGFNALEILWKQL